MCLTRILCFVPGVAACIGCEPPPGSAEGIEIRYYRLRAPGDLHDIEQASGLHYGRLGQREGLWLVCDRNGGESAGRVFFISAGGLKRAAHREAVIAEEAFTIVLSQGEWPGLAAAHGGAGAKVLGEVRRRIGATPGGGGPLLDLEAVTIGPSPEPPHEPRVFAVAEEPFSAVLELALEGEKQKARARLTAVYAYLEADDEHGTDFNDGLEGLAYAGEPGEFFWAEEGTEFHRGPPGTKLFFLAPRLGRAKLKAGRVEVDGPASEALTAAVRSQRRGDMQTLNGLAVTPRGQLLAVDRNGGWILYIDAEKRTARRWLNLYDLHGTNLREALATFPGERRMPYISIEGIAVDGSGTLWLVDDPAMPESFRASCLVRVTGLEALPTTMTAPASPSR